MIDSHCHLTDPYYGGGEEIIKNMAADGLEALVTIGYDAATSAECARLAGEHPDVYAAVGLHPSEIKEGDDIGDIVSLLGKPGVVALGEIGLDYHYPDDVEPSIQKKWFARQLELAKELDMPVVIHDRESKGECLEILKEHKISNGVVHCFSGSTETAREILKLGMMISFTGVLTFKNAKKAIAACAAVPLDRLMIETDCPYMSPEPHRGRRNFSGYVEFVAQKMAEIKGVSYDELVNITERNAKRFYGIN